MANTTLTPPFGEMHGVLSKKGIINRQKKFRDERGRVVHEGKQEAYAILHPRDFKKTPKTGAELANHSYWSEACRRASQIIQAGQNGGPTKLQLDMRRIEQIPDYYTLEEARGLFEEFSRRYRAQLPNTRGKHPDPLAPIDPKTGRGKRYAQFPAFVRTMLYYSLKSQQMEQL